MRSVYFARVETGLKDALSATLQGLKSDRIAVKLSNTFPVPLVHFFYRMPGRVHLPCLSVCDEIDGPGDASALPKK